MTPEAKAFRNAGIQIVRTRFQDWRYQHLRMDGAQSVIMHAHQMMVLGSLIFPETKPTTEVPDPPYYLDDAMVRWLIERELKLSAIGFFHHAWLGGWAALLPQDTNEPDRDSIVRRFYATNVRGVGGWRPVLVPTEEERDAPDSLYRPDIPVIPDLGSVTTAHRMQAVGLTA